MMASEMRPLHIACRWIETHDAFLAVRRAVTVVGNTGKVKQRGAAHQRGGLRWTFVVGFWGKKAQVCQKCGREIHPANRDGERTARPVP